MANKITVVSDISMDPDSGLATWAHIITTPNGSVRDNGILPGFKGTTYKAELLALFNALKESYNLVDNWREREVSIYCEIKDPLRNYKNTELTEIAEKCVHILSNSKGWQVKHIKAHYTAWERSSIRDIYGMNRWCDINARQLLRSACNSMDKSV